MDISDTVVRLNISLEVVNPGGRVINQKGMYLFPVNWLLNQDATLSPGWAKDLSIELQKHDIGAVVGELCERMTKERATEQHCVISSCE